jgi:fatty acid desaturase
MLNNWRGPLAVAGDYAVIAASIGLAHRFIWLLPLMVLIIGSRQRALASLLHDSSHRMLTRSRRLNDLLGRWAAGLPIFQSHEAYSASHIRHHACLGSAEHDPDYRQYIDSGLFEVRDRLDFLVHVVRTVLLFNVAAYIRYLIGHRLAAIRGNARECVGLVLVQLAIFGVLYFTVGPYGYVLYWLLPLVTSFQVIGWLSEIAEHYPHIRTAHTPLLMTRNRFPRGIERLIIGMHGDNYHLVHHLFAGIPFWNLVRAHDILMDDPEYRCANERVGGIFTARRGRSSVLKLILEDIRLRTGRRAVLFGEEH